MTYQSLTHLQFKRLLKNSFHSLRRELWNTTGRTKFFMSVEIFLVLQDFG